MTEFKRLADGRVEISGWAGSLKGNGTPLILFVLAGRTTVLQVETEGPEPNAAQTLELTDAGSGNIKFKGAFARPVGEPIRIVVTTDQRTYLTQFRTLPLNFCAELVRVPVGFRRPNANPEPIAGSKGLLQWPRFELH